MLNDEQRQMVESSIWVVNTALKKQGLEKNKDLKQDALLYMCQCAERFDASKGVKWTTYAYKNIYLFIKRTHAHEMKKSAPIIDFDLFDVSDGLLDLNEDLLDEINKEPMYNNPKYKLENVMQNCSPQERVVLKQRLKGYTQPEIAEQMGCNLSKINLYMKNIQQRERDKGLWTETGKYGFGS